MRIGEFIAYKRKSMGYTQQRFAEALGISKQAVSKWEKGTASPEFIAIPNLALFLDVTPEFLANAMWLDLSGNPLTHFIYVIVHQKREKPYVIKAYESRDYVAAQELYDHIRQGKHPDTARLVANGRTADPIRSFSVEFIEMTEADTEFEDCEFPIDSLLLDSCKLDM